MGEDICKNCGHKLAPEYQQPIHLLKKENKVRIICWCGCKEPKKVV